LRKNKEEDNQVVRIRKISYNNQLKPEEQPINIKKSKDK
jgi:hypothetical protein